MNKLYQYNGRKWVEIAKDGKNGITPVKGVDYFTEQEIESIEKKIREKIKVIHGKDGKDVDESVVKELQNKVNHALSIASRDYDFAELKDVSITNPTNGQVPKYNSTTGKWENGDVSSGGVQSVVAGTNILVDDTDPANPIVSSLSDRYKTTSATSHAIVSTGTLTFTVDPNLAYITQQDVIIAYDSNNHMHGEVVSYSGTTLIVDITHKTGSGTYASWSINLDGIAPTTPSLQQVTDVGASTTNAITALDLTSSNQTASRIASFDASKKIISLDTSTYPSLTELSYVKGVTSAIQTQLDGKLIGTSGAISTSYTNVGGSGNRTALITVTTTITGLNGTPDYLVNGNTTESFFYWTGQSASGKYLRFDFGSGNKFVITEAKWYQDLSTSQGVWQWQGSNDASSWTSIGSTFTLGGSATQTQTELSSNTTAYRYYQLLGVSGSLSGSPYDREIEFKISTAITGTTVDVTGRLMLQSNGNPLEIGGMTVFNSGVIYNSRPLVSSQWVNVGSNIQFPVTGNTAYVGIGKAPVTGYYLDVYRASRIASDTSNVPSIQYFTNSASNILRIVLDSPASPSFGVANGAVISLDNDASGLRIYDGSSTERYRFQRNGDAGFGTSATTISAKLHLIKTTEQLRVGYDASNYYSTTVGSTGGVTFNAVGTGASFNFSDDVLVPDEAYGSGWNGSLEVPTKNAVYDKIEAVAIETIGVAVSDETTDLTTGTAKVTFRMPFAMTLTSVRANVNTAPTGATIIVDIKESGTTILSTKISIDVSEKTSTTATTPPVISDSALADDAEITVNIDQIGSTIAGKGLKIWLIGTRA